MKNYGKILPIVLVFALLLSWYSLFSDAITLERQYKEYLSTAREKRDVGIIVLAVENYTQALNLKDNPDIYIEVADLYAEQGETRRYVEWCENFFDSHPKEPKAYDCILKAYYTVKDYESCFDIIYTAEKRHIQTDYITEINNTIFYYYEIDHASYEDVSIFSNNLAAVKNKGKWGYVNRYGVKRVPCRYEEVGVYTQAGCAPVRDAEGNIYFIDQDGNKIMATNDAYKSFGNFSNNLIATQRTDDKYTYLNEKFEIQFGDYDYASSMNGNIAAVKNGELWSVINEKGEKVIAQDFSAVILDEKEIAYRNERIFVKNADGKVMMLDAKGNQIGSQVYEDAKVFVEDSFAAVKVDEKWGFVDKDGNMKIEPQFTNARSFANGFAAVQIDDKWGFINEDGTVCIDPVFYDAKDFNEKGSCFVKVGENWQLLKLYRLNRED